MYQSTKNTTIVEMHKLHVKDHILKYLRFTSCGSGFRVGASLEVPGVCLGSARGVSKVAGVFAALLDTFPTGVSKVEGVSTEISIHLVNHLRILLKTQNMFP